MNGKIAICRSGGGLDGLDIHAGITRAFEEAGIHATELHGVSAGAIATAADSAGWGSKKFATVLQGISDTDVRDARTLWPLRVSFVPSIWAGDKIKNLLAELFPESWTEAFAKWQGGPHVYATRIYDADSIDMMSCHYAGSPREAIYASLAIPCVLPPYSFKGMAYRDGGVRKNLPLPKGWRDYDHVYLCVASGKREEYQNKNNTVSQALTCLEQLLADSVLDVLDEVRGAPNVTLIWPQPDSRGGMLHFDHSLQEKAYQHTRDVLSGKINQDEVLSAGLVAMANNANWKG